MNFSFESSLRPGEKVIWNGQMEKQQCDAAVKPAPPLAEVPRPNIRIREHVRKADSFKVTQRYRESHQEPNGA
jgi:hypothetical protein